MDYFSDQLGFGEYKPQAIKLLKKTLEILDEFNIQHMLISGTLLGYIRHNDFIPWDDDIDILVDKSIWDKKEKIAAKYGNLNLFYKNKYDSIKICFSNGFEIPNSNWNEYAIPSLLDSDKKYCFPFVDMFVFESGPGTHICGENGKIELNGQIKEIFLPFSGLCDRCFRFLKEGELVIFHNYWRKKDFFPLKQVDFLGIKCNIPQNPHRFLRKNYGPNYMSIIESPAFNHKTNTEITDITKQDYDRTR